MMIENILMRCSLRRMRVVVSLMAIGFGGCDVDAWEQDPSRIEPTKTQKLANDRIAPATDWVASSMPVSMNGEKDKSLPRHWTEKRWHDKFRTQPASFQVRFNWKAEKFFKDEMVIKLCEAIFAKDVPEMERLIAAGADVNLIGEDGMTPLYWAFHVDEDPRPFGCLLKHGANPNVIARLGRRKEIQLVIPGSAVVHLVANSHYNRHFKNVFENGGDPNLTRETPLFEARAFQMLCRGAPDAIERFQLLIAKGAMLDDRHANGHTFISALVVGGEEDRLRLALVGLKAGADYRLYYSNDGCYFRLIHYLAHAEPKVNERPVEEQTHYRAVVAWLEDHGESLAEAKADLKRWDEWKKDGELGLIEKEHQKRLAQEAEKKQSNEKNDRVQACR